MNFSSSERPPQRHILTDMKLNPGVTTQGALVVSENGRRFAVLGTATDPFAADQDKGLGAQTISEAEQRLSRARRKIS